MTNWAGNVRYAALTIEAPRSVAELQSLVARPEPVHALGSRHSFSAVADSPGTLVALDNLPRQIDIDSVARTMRVSGAVRFAEVGHLLHTAGFALPAMASLPHITLAGAFATATHGSGSRTQSLASTVSALSLVGADGELQTWQRETHEQFPGTVVALGALGIVVGMTVRLVPTFAVRQRVFEGLPFATLCEHLHDIQTAAHSVSVFTDWDDARTVSIWFKERDDESADGVVDQDWFNAAPAPADRHPVPGRSAMGTTAQQGRPGPWHDRLPHFRSDHAPSSSGAEIQSEYIVARADGPAALQALDAVRADIHRAVQTCEIRTVAADDLWLSPFYDTDAVAVHFTWVPDSARVTAAIATVETALASVHARPHWGKVFAMDPVTVRSRMPRLADFRALAQQLDPTGKFLNRFLREYLDLPG